MASENELKWLDLYLETGDAQGAARQIFDCSEKNIPAKASHLKTKLEDEIDQRLAKVIKRNAIAAQWIISDLMKNAKQESTKLKAAQDILSRAGYDSTMKFENVTKEETYPELINRLQAAFTGLDQNVLSEILGNTEDLKQIQLLAMGQVGSEQ